MSTVSTFDWNKWEKENLTAGDKERSVESQIAHLKSELERAHTDLFVLRGKLDWRRIEQAPRDGTVILTWTPEIDEKAAYSAMWFDAERGWCEFFGHYDLRPAFWIPLLEAPKL